MLPKLRKLGGSFFNSKSSRFIFVKKGKLILKIPFASEVEARNTRAHTRTRERCEGPVNLMRRHRIPWADLRQVRPVDVHAAGRLPAGRVRRPVAATTERDAAFLAAHGAPARGYVRLLLAGLVREIRRRGTDRLGMLRAGKARPKKKKNPAIRR